MAPTSSWPFPGESPVIRARRCALAYRALAADAGADVSTLDAKIREWGETWLALSVVVHGPDDWLTAAQAAEMAHTTPHNIRAARRRGRITGRKGANGEWQFLARDVATLSSRVRSRKPRGTVTLAD